MQVDCTTSDGSGFYTPQSAARGACVGQLQQQAMIHTGCKQGGAAAFIQWPQGAACLQQAKCDSR